MVILERGLPPDHTIIFSGDWHVGSVLSYPKVMEAVKEEVLANRHAYLEIPGDLCEGITIDDPRFCMETDQKWTPHKQYKIVKEFLRPIKHKILAVNFGNHDWALINYGNMVKDEICEGPESLNVPYGTFASKISITYRGKPQYKIYVTHGKKPISSTASDPITRKANMELILKRHLREKAADCLVMIKAHVHKLLTISPTHALYLYDDGANINSDYVATRGEEYIHPDLRWYGCSGSGYKLYADPALQISSYAERAEYDPNELGYLRLTVQGGVPINLAKVVIA